MKFVTNQLVECGVLAHGYLPELFDAKVERKAFDHLRQRLEMEATQYAKVLNGCQVHVIGKALVGFDLTG